MVPLLISPLKYTKSVKVTLAAKWLTEVIVKYLLCTILGTRDLTGNRFTKNSFTGEHMDIYDVK